jgi:very-short-patch-repair endonuclease
MVIFDPRQLSREHILAAVKEYRSTPPKHHPARSAFLRVEEKLLPAKQIIRLAFRCATGELPTSEQLTGGRASVQLLRNLGFEAIYEKQPNVGNRNKVKNARREAFRQLLAARFGSINLEERFPVLCVPDLVNRSSMPIDLRRILVAIESVRQMPIKGRSNYCLGCDFYIPDHRLIIEFDERQHFTLARAASLKAYPADAPVAFDRERWIALSEEIQAGDNSPIYRDEQRAFYDAIRDIVAPQIGFKPVVRVFEEDVLWERESTLSDAAKSILDSIETLSSLT